MTQRPSSHDTAPLIPKLCKRGLVSIVSGSQPKGRGFESRLKLFCVVGCVTFPSEVMWL
ncbi:MAG: hypothetical protein PV344_04335 [Anaplasma sp.]|nr:hypothetical protein [Anaplasma sp.]